MKNIVEIRRKLTDDNGLYLQKNYMATNGIFLDENVIFVHVDLEETTTAELLKRKIEAKKTRKSKLRSRKEENHA